MIKNIEKITAKEYLRQQLKEGKVPTCPIRAGEKVQFSPNEITLRRAEERNDR